MRVSPVTTAAWLLLTLPLSAQQPPQQTPPVSPATPAPSAPAAAAPVLPGEPDSTFTYQREGRRDPFLSLVGAGSEQRTPGSRRGEGPAGLLVSEISVRGIVQSKGDLVAMVHGPDNHTYIVHQGDKFADGTIKAVTPQGLIIVQDVNDPLSLVKQREVRKLLRSLEDAKE